MKQLRWKDFSLVSKIVIEVGMIAVLLFAMNMLFYVRINNSMQKMDNVYASNAELTELSQVFEKVQDNMYKYLKVKNSQTLLDYYQNEAKYRNELEKLNEDNINDPVKLLERNIRKMSETYLDCTAETVAAKRGRNVEQYKRKYDDATKLYSLWESGQYQAAFTNIFWLNRSFFGNRTLECLSKEIPDTFYTRCGLYITTHPLHGTSLDNS